jgi:hypothetical protein
MSNGGIENFTRGCGGKQKYSILSPKEKKNTKKIKANNVKISLIKLK